MSRATKSPSGSSVHRLVVTVALAALWLHVAAQVPDAPNPQRLVNDFASILTSAQIQTLEDTLVAFDNRTSNQIVVVTMSDLGDITPAQMAYEIGQKWGVGTDENNNGIVILIKPKTDTKGQVFIAPGYGLEGALPDATCKRIIQQQMLPQFSLGDYYAGIVAALNEIMPRAAGEYSDERQQDDSGSKTAMAVAVIVMIIIIIIIAFASEGKGGGNSKNGGSGTIGSGGIFLGPIIFGSGSRGGSGLGGFGSGGGLGGFGGFGGGGFGGGGAGGSW